MFISNRTPIGVRLASTNETILRVPVQRSGYAVVRFGGRYFELKGGPNVRPYILDADESTSTGQA